MDRGNPSRTFGDERDRAGRLLLFCRLSAIIYVLVAASCMPAPSGMAPEEQPNVVLLPAGQETTLHLQDTCEEAGSTERIDLSIVDKYLDKYSLTRYHIKLRAEARGANAAQIIYWDLKNKAVTVRYWRCP